MLYVKFLSFFLFAYNVIFKIQIKKMVLMIFGIPVGYYLLFGGMTVAGCITPYAVKKITSLHKNVTTYSKTLSWEQNASGCCAILAWVANNQHLFQNCERAHILEVGNEEHGFRQIQLPQFNEEFEFVYEKNKSLYLTFLSHDGINCSGIKLSVTKRSFFCWLTNWIPVPCFYLGKHKQAILNMNMFFKNMLDQQDIKYSPALCLNQPKLLKQK